MLEASGRCLLAGWTLWPDDLAEMVYSCLK